MSSGGEVECTGWSGGVAHYISSDEELAATSGGSEDEVDELSGSELEEVIQQNRERSARGMAAGCHELILFFHHTCSKPISPANLVHR